MLEKVKTILWVLLVWFLVSCVIATVHQYNENRGSGVTETAKNVSHRNSFISGCKKEYTKSDAVDVCGCAYDSLKRFEPNFDSEEVTNRIIHNGYTQAETDVIVRCIPEVQTL